MESSLLLRPGKEERILDIRYQMICVLKDPVFKYWRARLRHWRTSFNVPFVTCLESNFWPTFLKSWGWHARNLLITSVNASTAEKKRLIHSDQLTIRKGIFMAKWWLSLSYLWPSYLILSRKYFRGKQRMRNWTNPQDFGSSRPVSSPRPSGWPRHLRSNWGLKENTFLN